MPLQGLLNLLLLYNTLLFVPGYEEHCRALEDCEPLSSTLLELLLPAFLYSAVWVQLPAEKRDARMPTEGVLAIARALSGSKPIRERLLARMRAGDAQAAQVFRAALQIAQLPPAAPSTAGFAGDMAAHLFERLSQLLNDAAAVALSAWPPQQQRAAA